MKRSRPPVPRSIRLPSLPPLFVPPDFAPYGAGPPALDAISAARLRRDLYHLAGDALNGREAGTEDELRTAMWLCERAHSEGLEPAGRDGTYVQFFPMRRLRQSETSWIKLGDVNLMPGRDAVTFGPVRCTLPDTPLLFVPPEAAVDPVAVRGRFVATVACPPAQCDPPGISMEQFRHAIRTIGERSQAFLCAGAVGVVIASDDAVEHCFDDAGTAVFRGRYGLDEGPDTFHPDPAPVIWVRAALAGQLQRPGITLRAGLDVDNFVYPSANVVACVPGTDPSLAHEYVLFSGHLDHDGLRPRGGADPIRHGADDNGSMSAALLAIGRAWRRHPARRSALFVWHGAEERGLLGSNWFAKHPTVPAGSIVAVLNGDMIGRNAPDMAALLGAEPPNCNSRALVSAALAANERVGHFSVDTSWDHPDHPEAFYFRSDHLPYARAGIPALFFTTELHADYHEPSDTPDRIDYDKLARMARWIYATGWLVANADERPAPDTDLDPIV